MALKKHFRKGRGSQREGQEGREGRIIARVTYSKDTATASSVAVKTAPRMTHKPQQELSSLPSTPSFLTSVAEHTWLQGLPFLQLTAHVGGLWFATTQDLKKTTSAKDSEKQK